MFLDVIPQADAAHFLFTFDQHFNIDGKVSTGLVKRFECFDVDVHLTLVIGGAAAIEIPVANRGVKGGRSPEVEGFRRLDVIMAIEKYGWLAGRFEGLRIHQGVEFGGNDLNRFKPG